VSNYLLKTLVATYSPFELYNNPRNVEEVLKWESILKKLGKKISQLGRYIVRDSADNRNRIKLRSKPLNLEELCRLEELTEIREISLQRKD